MRGLQHEGQDSLERTFVGRGSRLLPGKGVGEQPDVFHVGEKGYVGHGHLLFKYGI